MTDFGMPTLIEIPDLEQSAALCRRLGLKFMEINMSFPQYQPECLDADRLLELKEKYGIYFTVHIDESLDPACVNAGVAQAYLDTMLKTVALAKKAGIPVLNMHLQRGVYVTLPERRTYIYAENQDFYLGKMREFRDRVTEAIGSSDVMVCVENTDGGDCFALPFLAAAADTLLESPAFGLTLDVGHDYLNRNVDQAFILARRERLHHMHLHDALGKNVHLALGDGEIDKERFLKLAGEQGCRVLLETKTVEALQKSTVWVNHWLNRGCNSDEVWDVYDAQRQKTGRTHRRGEPLGEGEFHLVMHCWMRNSRGEYLLTRRSPEKSYGGRWESSGGSALAGEDSLTAVLREVKEETGLTLDPARGKCLRRYSREHYICDVWLFEQDFDLNDIVLQEGETCGAMYASPEKLRELVNADCFVPFEELEGILEM